MPETATGQTASISLFALMLSGIVAFAAEPTGPRTLENLLTAADAAPEQAAVEADKAPNAAEEPPAARKNDPLQQRLDAALAEYNPAIEKAIDELAKEIEEEFNKATKKGDIDLARKCKEAEAALRERGTPPDGDFLKHAREETYRKITRAGARLSAEFDAVAKECLKAGDLDRAEAVLSEKADLLAEIKGWRALKNGPSRPITSAATNRSPTKRQPLISMEFVPVSDVNNTPDENGRGGVGYEYLIGKYEVTVGQYVAFLNAIAKDDPHGVYDERMDLGRGGLPRQVQRIGLPGAYRYSVTGGAEGASRPIACIDIYDAIRFCNWMHNGQGASSTEDGAYDLAAIADGEIPARSPAAKYFVPTDSEWYKAAFYDPTKNGVGGYWRYATRSDTPPAWGEACLNHRSGVYRGLMPVVAFPNSVSYYGCCGMAGSLEERTETGNVDINFNGAPEDANKSSGGPLTAGTHEGCGFRIGAKNRE